MCVIYIFHLFRRNFSPADIGWERNFDGALARIVFHNVEHCHINLQNENETQERTFVACLSYW